MKAKQLRAAHIGQTLIINQSGKRRRGKILDLDARPSTFIWAKVDYFTKGVEMVALPLDTDIEIEI